MYNHDKDNECFSFQKKKKKIRGTSSTSFKYRVHRNRYNRSSKIFTINFPYLNVDEF